jgi:hypothetical protein
LCHLQHKNVLKMMYNKVTENRKINHSNRNKDSVQDSYILKKIKKKIFLYNVKHTPVFAAHILNSGSIIGKAQTEFSFY